MQPTVTIVVPIYKVEKYLDRCLISIVSQSYRNMEIILVDDGSPDNCPNICDKWAQRDSRIRVVHKKNEGLGMARNTGIEHAKGDYICFFDSDDYVDSRAIEKACKCICSSNSDIVIFGVSSVNSKGEIFKSDVPKPLKRFYSGEEVQEVFLPDLIDPRNSETKNKNLCLSAWACMYSMDLLRKINWRFVSERQNISEDSYSLIELYKHVRSVAILPEALYYYCENEMSLTRSYRTDRYEKIKKFYYDCCKLADRMEYCYEVKVRISGLFLSLTIAAMKQVVASDMSGCEKRKMIRQIVCDKTMKEVLSTNKCRYQKKERK